MLSIWALALTALLHTQNVTSTQASTTDVIEPLRSSAISYDELVLVGSCPLTCSEIPSPGTFDRDWVAYNRWAHSRHDYLPGYTFHVAYLGSWARVDDRIRHIISICNRRTNDFIAIDPIEHLYWHSRAGSAAWFGGHGCGNRVVGPGVFLGMYGRVYVDSKAIDLPAISIDGVASSGRRIYYRYYERLPMRRAPLAESTIEIISYRARFEEPCPPADSIADPKNFDFCAVKGTTPFRLFVKARQIDIPGFVPALAVNGNTIVVERGHIRPLAAKDIRQFAIPSGYGDVCKSQKKKSVLSTYCPFDNVQK